jgi:hypothetical protein
MARILYLYRSPRRIVPGGPTEFGYGADELEASGHTVDRIDGTALAAMAGAASPSTAAPGAAWSAAARLFPWFLPGIPPVQLGHLAAPAVVRRLAEYDAVVATTTGLGLAAGFAKRRGLFGARLIVLAMGILADTRPFLERRICAWLLGSSTLATLSTVELRHLRARLGPMANVFEVGFGVDTGFWSPDPSTPRGKDVLAIGNDLSRDWACLVAAWRPEFPLLRIISRAPLPPLPANVERLAGSLDAPAVDEIGLRDLYRRAACVVVPMRQTIQPAGQSVALQAMACGAPVLISRIEGLWDDRMRTDGDICRTVPPDDPRALSAVVASVLADRRGAVAMADRALAHVGAQRGLRRMAERLGELADRGRLA